VKKYILKNSTPAESALHETHQCDHSPKLHTTRLQSRLVALVCRPSTAMATSRSLAALSSARDTRLGPLRAGSCPPRAAARAAAAEPERARRLVAEFDPAVPLDAAMTPPSGWYTDQDFLGLELDRVFLRGWQAVGTPDWFPPSLDLILSSGPAIHDPIPTPTPTGKSSAEYGLRPCTVE
jgi:choline monooxygenase